MNSSGKTVRWEFVARLLIGAGLLLYVFSRFIPSLSVNDYPVGDGLDNAWTQALHLAFVRHWQFGTDIVFTYGPWGFLARGYDPQTYPVAVAAWIILSVVFICAGWRLARSFAKNRLVAGLWLMGFTAVASIPAGEDFNTRLVAWGVLLLFLHFFAEENTAMPVKALLVVSLGWLSLVKFTGLMESLMAVAVIAADYIFRQRRFPWVVPLWLASCLFFWVVAGQHLSSLAPFWCNSWRITGGYTEAMMLDGRMEPRHAVYFLLIALPLCALAGRLAWARLGFFCALPAAGLGMILFIAFKLGYVRNGWQHETTSALALVISALACLLAARPEKKRWVAAAAGLLMVSTLFAGSVFHFWLPGNGLHRQIAGTFSIYSLFAPVAAPCSGYLRDEYEKNLAGERKRFPLPPLAGTTDLYSYAQTVLFAHELPYQPRPVMQSYSAYTPALAEMNAAHLRTAQAPDNILFAIQPIDGRFPSLDDGKSWPELLTRYDLKSQLGDQQTFLLLSRAKVAREFHLTPLANTLASFGEPVFLPRTTNGPVWVEIEIPKTLVGTVVSALYKPAVLELTVSLQDHTKQRFRLVPGMAASGFLLSPLVTDARDFAALAATGGRESGAGRSVESMTVSALSETGSTVCYQSPMRIRFFCLQFPAQDFKIETPLSPATHQR